ncbi:hypothetical protein KSP39_PZI001866 [Platanthera zijinensis]|uniref:Uncharacterized protein n=1 Tax=Platanthera zijinensis TaxID=2320716 RepID=A0AAP0GDX9_9ASPA
MGDSYTVHISSNLLHHLTHEAKNPKNVKAKPPKTRDELKPASYAAASSSTPQKWPVQPPLFRPARPPSPAVSELEAIKKVVQEGKAVLEKVEKREEDMIQELTKRAKVLHEKEFKLPYQKLAPCLNEREACLLCYKEHLEDPLSCASLVEKFADCARQARRKLNPCVGR